MAIGDDRTGQPVIINEEEPEQNQPVFTNEQFSHLAGIIQNNFIYRRETLQRLLDPTRDIDKECKYPITIDKEDYKSMFKRMGVGTRVVYLWPEESWPNDPEVHETEDSTETAFEKEVKKLSERIPLFNYLFRADVLSGIGQYGVLLLGIDDGLELNKPITSINEKGETTGKPSTRKLLYLRPFDESQVEIKSWENDVNNPRFGYPKSYKLKFLDETNNSISAIDLRGEAEVHWSRIIHIADNRTSSEIVGTPRMEPVWNNLLDIKKIAGGSAEMFYRGGFPGLALELSPDVQKSGNQIEVDTDALEAQMLKYGEGLQRWLYTTGLTAKSLAPQVADPVGHLECAVKLVAMSLGVPYRLLLGTEEAKLAGNQDKRAWIGRVAKRQTSYCTPRIVRPFFDRLIAIGVLPQPGENYMVTWPDLDAPTDADVAATALTRTDAMAKYVAGGVNELVPPKEYFTIFHKMSVEEAEAIATAAESFVAETEADDELERSQTIEDDERHAKLAGDVAERTAKAKADSTPPKPSTRE